MLKADEQTVHNIEEDLKLQSQEDIQKIGYVRSMFELTKRLQSQYFAANSGLLVAILLGPGEAVFFPKVLKWVPMGTRGYPSVSSAIHFLIHNAQVLRGYPTL